MSTGTETEAATGTRTERGTIASTSSSVVVSDDTIRETLNTNLETYSRESNGTTTNDIDISIPRTRSVFPTTDESRKSMYRSGSSKVIEYDSMTVIAEKVIDQVVKKTETVTTVKEIAGPSISTGVDVEVEIKTKKEVRREDIENEFNHIMPEELTEAERYEERIRQLESAPLPCIDAITGLVHIVGNYSTYQNGVLAYFILFFSRSIMKSI